MKKRCKKYGAGFLLFSILVWGIPAQAGDALATMAAHYSQMVRCTPEKPAPPEIKAAQAWLAAADKEFTTPGDRESLIGLLRAAVASGHVIALARGLPPLQGADGTLTAFYHVRAQPALIRLSTVVRPGHKRSQAFQVAMQLAEALAALENLKKNSTPPALFAGLFDPHDTSRVFSDNQVTNRWLAIDPKSAQNEELNCVWAMER